MERFNEMIILPLGTVSPYCKENFNCPGFLITNGDAKILLDCGNGISRYLNMETDLNDLIIIITHLHRDHYGELTSIAYASLIYKKLGYISNKIKVYIPSGDMIEYQEHYLDNDGWGCSKTKKKSIPDYEYLMSLSNESYLEFIDYDDRREINHDKMKVNFKRNPHPITTYSVKITDGENSLVYSSDTGYRGNCLTKFAENADMLICESSFIRGQNKSDDFHLFAYEAGKIAKDAKVKQLVLTHFWPEIEKEKYVIEAMKEFKNTIAAEEGKKLILKK